MEITLEAKEGELVVHKYIVNYPFSVHKHHRNANKILRTTSSLKCKNIQGSFRLYYSRKIDFTNFANNNAENDAIGGSFNKLATNVGIYTLKTDGQGLAGTAIKDIEPNYFVLKENFFFT